MPHGELRPETLPCPFPTKLSHAPTAQVAMGGGGGERRALASKIFPKARSRAFLWDENETWHFNGSMGSNGGSTMLLSCLSPWIKIALWLLPVKQALIGIINRNCIRRLAQGGRGCLAATTREFRGLGWHGWGLSLSMLALPPELGWFTPSQTLCSAFHDVQVSVKYFLHCKGIPLCTWQAAAGPVAS